MTTHIEWLEKIVEALADARAVLACFGVDHPELVALIEAALNEAHTLKPQWLQP